ncbi:MAG: hypothetical protein U9P37_06605 [Pseudomonadota bacterium]|nr:hypothetical protein [Pseudomonadota bacterium]
MKPSATIFIYTALAREIRYHAISKGYNIEVPDFGDLSRTMYQELRRQVLNSYGTFKSLTEKIDSIFDELDALLKKHLKAEDIKLYHQTGEQIVQVTSIEKEVNTKSKEKLLKLVSMLDAAYLFAVDPADKLKTTEKIIQHIQNNKIVANGN